MLPILLAVVFFGCVALVGVDLSKGLCVRIAPLEGAPASLEPPTLVLTAAGAFIGAALVSRGATTPQLISGAIVVMALAGGWASDSLRGLVLNVFTLVPLALLLLLAVLRRDWLVLISAAVAFIPFATAALFTGGRGMGWGDAKLVALAGAALGAPLAILAMIAACAAAVVGYKVKRMKDSPIAFAPYIAAFVGLALPFGVVR